MKAEEKARELYQEFHEELEAHLSDGENAWVLKQAAKQCALIAVDEILKLGFIFFGDAEKDNNPEFWNEVKQEIEKL